MVMLWLDVVGLLKLEICEALQDRRGGHFLLLTWVSLDDILKRILL